MRYINENFKVVTIVANDNTYADTLNMLYLEGWEVKEPMISSLAYHKYLYQKMRNGHQVCGNCAFFNKKKYVCKLDQIPTELNPEHRYQYCTLDRTSLTIENLYNHS